MTKQIYDGEDVFRHWCEMGAAASNPRLLEYSKNKYGRVSQMGPTYAMWRWAFYNVETAYPLYKEWWFNKYPEEPPLTMEGFVQILQKKAGGMNVRKRDVERLCAKYGIEMDFKIKKDDVVQVVKSNHPLYQVTLIVDGVNHEKVDAHYFVPDKVYPEANGRESVRCELNIREIGVVGKAIV